MVAVSDTHSVSTFVIDRRVPHVLSGVTQALHKPCDIQVQRGATRSQRLVIIPGVSRAREMRWHIMLPRVKVSLQNCSNSFPNTVVLKCIDCMQYRHGSRHTMHSQQRMPSFFAKVNAIIMLGFVCVKGCITPGILLPGLPYIKKQRKTG